MADQERQRAIVLANVILDRVNADPDSDECILARQFLRAIEARVSQGTAPATPDAVCEACGRFYAEHSRDALALPNDANWQWSESACPIGEFPFHPTQTFVARVEGTGEGAGRIDPYCPDCGSEFACNCTEASASREPEPSAQELIAILKRLGFDENGVCIDCGHDACDCARPAVPVGEKGRTLEAAEAKLAENGIIWELGGYVFDGKR